MLHLGISWARAGLRRLLGTAVWFDGRHVLVVIPELSILDRRHLRTFKHVRIATIGTDANETAFEANPFQNRTGLNNVILLGFSLFDSHCAWLTVEVRYIHRERGGRNLEGCHREHREHIAWHRGQLPKPKAGNSYFFFFAAGFLAAFLAAGFLAALAIVVVLPLYAPYALAAHVGLIPARLAPGLESLWSESIPSSNGIFR